MSNKEVRFIHYSVTGNAAIITAHNGESRSEFTQEQIVGQIVANVDQVPDVFVTAGGEEKSVKAYGLNSLLQDRSSQATGQAAKFEHMQAEWNRLCGEGALWSAQKESAPKAPKAAKVDSFLAAAIGELKGVSVSVATVMLGKLDKEQLAALAANEAVKAKVAELKAQADAADGMDLSDLL